MLTFQMAPIRPSSTLLENYTPTSSKIKGVDSKIISLVNSPDHSFMPARDSQLSMNSSSVMRKRSCPFTPCQEERGSSVSTSSFLFDPSGLISNNGSAMPLSDDPVKCRDPLSENGLFVFSAQTPSQIGYSRAMQDRIPVVAEAPSPSQGNTVTSCDMMQDSGTESSPSFHCEDSSSVQEPPHTPTKRYQVQRVEGRLGLRLTPRIRKQLKEHTPALYSWKCSSDSSQSEKRLIGISGRLDGRLASYSQRVNSPRESDVFAQEMLAHPEDFSWGIIRTLAPEEESAQAETDEILFHGRHKCYNQRLGGGGGKQQTQSLQECPFRIDQIVEMIKTGYQSPTTRLMRRVKQRLVFDLDEQDRKMKELIYDIVIDRKASDQGRIHHIGYTTTYLNRRLGSHIRYINKPEACSCKSLQNFYTEISRMPESVYLCLFKVDYLLDKGISLPIIEEAFMLYFAQKGETVRNNGCGRRGGVAHSYQVRVPKEIPSGAEIEGVQSKNRV